MNKTININLGGLVFYIDEDAYQQLKNYLSAIERSLSSSEGKEEIIADIESRIAELFNEKLKDNKQVINQQDVHSVIQVMGEPKTIALMKRYLAGMKNIPNPALQAENCTGIPTTKCWQVSVLD